MPRHSNGSALGGQKRRRRFCKMWKPRRRSFGMDEAKHFEMLLDSKFVRSYAGPSNQWIRVVHSNFAFQNAGITGPRDKQDPSGDNDWARSPQPGLQVCGQSGGKHDRCGALVKTYLDLDFDIGLSMVKRLQFAHWPAQKPRTQRSRTQQLRGDKESDRVCCQY